MAMGGENKGYTQRFLATGRNLFRNLMLSQKRCHHEPNGGTAQVEAAKKTALILELEGLVDLPNSFSDESLLEWKKRLRARPVLGHIAALPSFAM
jgi:hypothetical protein